MLPTIIIYAAPWHQVMPLQAEIGRKLDSMISKTYAVVLQAVL